MNQDWRMKRKLEVYKGHGEEITGLEYSINGDYLASGGNDNVVNIWSQSYYRRSVQNFKGHRGAVKALSWSMRKYNYIITGGGCKDMMIKMWNIND